MATEIRLPDLGEGIAEAEILAWHVAVGDVVAEHQTIAELETDKAVVELPSPKAGRVVEIRRAVGEIVAVGAVLLAIEVDRDADAGDDDTAAAAAESHSSSIVGNLDARGLDLETQAGVPLALSARGSTSRSEARALAEALGLSLDAVLGKAPPAATTAPDDAEGQTEVLRGTRRTVARQMQRAVNRAPLATHCDELELPSGFGSEPPRPLARILVAVVQTLRAHPRWNAWFEPDAETLRVMERIHLGVAVDTPAGLMVPVLRDADGPSGEELEVSLRDLAAACRDRSIPRESLRGSTFTVSNIGALGGTFSTPIPNPPEVGILATGRIRECPFIDADGKLAVKRQLPCSLTFDHRVLDGADAARFLRSLEGFLLMAPLSSDV